MKLTISLTAAAAPFVLLDDTVPIVQGANYLDGAGGRLWQDSWRSDHKRQAQWTPLFRGAYQFGAPRYNLLNTLTFEVFRIHDTSANATSFITFHPDSIPAVGELTWLDTAAGANLLSYLPNAILLSAECTQRRGVSHHFRYIFQAANAWQTAP